MYGWFKCAKGKLAALTGEYNKTSTVKHYCRFMSRARSKINAAIELNKSTTIEVASCQHNNGHLLS
jgi:hypothetical protein